MVCSNTVPWIFPFPIYDRRELDESERIEYINAIYCLRERPSYLPNEEFPGVRDRLDDFVA